MTSFFKKLEKSIRHRLRQGRPKSANSRIRDLERTLATTRLLVADLHVHRVRALPPDAPLHEAEFKVTSQFGEDGILQFLTRQVACPDRRFVEFGVEDFLEANCRFLMERDPWQGLVMDGDPRLQENLRRQPLNWSRNLKGRSAFITAENINDLLAEEGFTGDLGILSIDIDGNDYWVWKAVTVASPRIVIIEYNSVFGPLHPVVVPYRPDFRRQSAHFSWLYAGASLPALCHLAQEKGYAFIGSNTAGNNAFFVRRDVLGSLRPITPEEGYMESTFRESRDASGEMTFLSGRERLEAIQDLPFWNVETASMVNGRDLLPGNGT